MIRSHDCTRASFRLLRTELIGIVKLAHFVLGSPYERPASECPTVHDYIRSPMAGIVCFAIDGLLRRSQVLTDADAVTSVTRERASSCFATTCSTNSVAQPRLHTTGSRYVITVLSKLDDFATFKKVEAHAKNATF